MVEITYLGWGVMEVTIDGHRQRFKDCKIWPGGAREWDWSETGTRHRPGIQPADVKEVVENGAEVVILSRGQWGQLGVQEETEAYLREQGILYSILKTPEAVRQFNDLVRQGRRVGGLFHSTC